MAGLDGCLADECLRRLVVLVGRIGIALQEEEQSRTLAPEETLKR